jgi:hypothetical protein
MKQKLTDDEVKLIKLLCNTGCMTHDKIANLMGVSRPHISKISKGVKRPDVVVSNNPTIKRLILLEYFDGNYTLRDL